MISILIHTHNEEKNIKECIESARLLTDSIIVIDMESTDKTCEIAKSENVEITSFPFSRYVEPARAFGIKQAKNEWVFILDADERMTKELAEEINKVVTSFKLPASSAGEQPTTAYKVPRKNIFGRKRWLKHGGWYPDYQLRLINTKYFKEWSDRIHSTPIIEGVQGFLKEPLLHYFHGDITEMVKKTMVYEEIEAQLLFEARRPVSIFTFFRKFFGELTRRLILKRGFMDGKYGIIESFYQAYSKTITYLFLYEKYFNEKKKSSSL